MRGVNYFPQDDEAEWRRIYDRHIHSWRTQKERDGRNFEERPTTLAEFDQQFQVVVTANEYHHWRQRQDLSLEGQRVLWKNVSELKIESLQEITFDRPRLAPFKLKYDTIDEVRMRYHKTIILVKGNPFYVTDQRSIKNEFYLLLEDAFQNKAYCPIESIPDLRPPTPGYVRISEANGYFKRHPARVNQQGITAQSVSVRSVGSRDNISFSNNSLVEALFNRGKSLPWESAYRKLIDDRVVSSFRLSDTLALYKKPNFDPVVVEYKGRRLGELTDHTVKVFDEDDVIQPWLREDAQKVNLEVAA